MIEIKWIETHRKEKDGKQFICDEYDVGYYKVAETTTIFPNGDSYRRVHVYAQRSNDKNSSLYYLPDIYCEDNFGEGPIKAFEIQTTSYGPLDLNHFAKFLKMQQYAAEVVEALYDKYIAHILPKM